MTMTLGVVSAKPNSAPSADYSSTILPPATTPCYDYNYAMGRRKPA